MNQAGHGLEYHNVTFMHPAAAAALVILSALILIRNAKETPLWLILGLMVIPAAQRIAVAELDFSVTRLLVIAALAKVFLLSDRIKLRRSPMDVWFVIWVVWGLIATASRSGAGPGIVSAFGWVLEIGGAFLVGRMIHQPQAALRKAGAALTWIAVFSAIVFMLELTTARNAFSFLGGVPEITNMRQGALRCQGPFSHPIMAGISWALMFPIIWASRGGFSAWQTIVGAIAISVITFATASSTPLLGLIVAIGGCFCMRLSGRMKPALIAGAVMVLTLHLVMERGFQHLLARVNVISGSTGYHRFRLIDAFLSNVSEWWLFGTFQTGHWGRGLQDVTNQFVLEGVRSGLVGLVAFIGIIVALLVNLDGAMQVQAKDDPEGRRRYLWSGQVFVIVASVSFMGVSYFGQTNGLFFLLLGLFGSLGVEATKPMLDPSRSPGRRKVSSAAEVIPKQGRRGRRRYSHP